MSRKSHDLFSTPAATENVHYFTAGGIAVIMISISLVSVPFRLRRDGPSTLHARLFACRLRGTWGSLSHMQTVSECQGFSGGEMGL